MQSLVYSVSVQNRPVHTRLLITDHSKQTAFVTDLFTTDPLITRPHYNRPVRNRSVRNRPTHRWLCS